MKITSANIRAWSLMGSGGAFGQAILELAKINKNVVALTADLPVASGLGRFMAMFPERFFDVGIAEQNLVGVAAGLAKEGFTPFATAQAAFLSLRCAEQTKVSMGYMKLPIKLVGLLSGFAVGAFGPTHMAVEDIALIRSIPNILLLSPADSLETVKATVAAAETDRPIYLRLSGGVPNPIVYKEDYGFEIGKAVTLREGSEIAIIASGSMVSVALRVAQELAEKEDISAKVVNMHTIKPLDTAAIDGCLGVRLIVTAEEHSAIGGLGSAVSEYLAHIAVKPPLMIVGIDDYYPHAGGYDYLMKQAGLSADAVLERILSY